MVRYVCIALMLIMVPALSSAEFYKYRDKSGTLRFTDNLAEVPIDQRKQMTNYKETDDYLTPEQKARKAKEEAAEEATEESGEAPLTAETIDAERRKLAEKKISLDEEGLALKKERDDLNKERDAVKNDAEAAAYDEKVRSLNTRIVDYEKRTLQFKDEVKDLDEKEARLRSSAEGEVEE